MPLVSFILTVVSFDHGTRLARGDLRPRLTGTVALLGAALMFGGWRLLTLDQGTPSENTLRIGVVQIDPSYNDATKDARRLGLFTACRFINLA